MRDPNLCTGSVHRSLGRGRWHAVVAVGGQGHRLRGLCCTQWCSTQLPSATCGRPTRGLRLRMTTTACRGRLTWPLLHAAAASRLWQTREHPPLNATARLTSPAHGLGHRQHDHRC
ncbi:hypothetical protein B296_00026491 [Ensete ventricosum]|uniref:Uncharacterized protein n=1 Tax=Ensete ventricosum TaxID=4639 RepID=A0A426Y8B7_ENSVE|nr:hypothetical protein B296_00026491 [Ensete ventricosum]